MGKCLCIEHNSEPDTNDYQKSPSPKIQNYTKIEMPAKAHHQQTNEIMTHIDLSDTEEKEYHEKSPIKSLEITKKINNHIIKHRISHSISLSNISINKTPLKTLSESESNPKKQQSKQLSIKTSSIQTSNYSTKDITIKKTTHHTFVDYTKLQSTSKNFKHLNETKIQKRKELKKRNEKHSRNTSDDDIGNISYSSWFKPASDKYFIQTNPQIITNNISEHKITRNVSKLEPLNILFPNKQLLILIGYLRNISLDNCWIIPISIINLCYEFIPKSSLNLFVISGCSETSYLKYHWISKSMIIGKKEELFNKEKQMISQSIIFDIYKNEACNDKIKREKVLKIKTMNEEFDCIQSGVSFCKNIHLTKNICIKCNLDVDVCGKYGSKMYSALFKCGGEIFDTDYNFSTNYASCILFNSNIGSDSQTFSDEKHIKTFELRLPKLPLKSQYICEYSNDYGLISIPMFKNKSNQCFQLLLNERNGRKLQWLKMQKMNFYHSYGNMCMVNGNTHLVVFGGSSDNKLEIYDFDDGQWRILNECQLYGKMSYFGICYNLIFKKLYFGGGQINQKYNKCGCFDIEKNMWYALPDMNLKHRRYPKLWINEYESESPHLLYVYGNDGGSIGQMEYFDLRDSKQKWTVVYNTLLDEQKWSNIRNLVM